MNTSDGSHGWTWKNTLTLCIAWGIVYFLFGVTGSLPLLPLPLIILGVILRWRGASGKARIVANAALAGGIGFSIMIVIGMVFTVMSWE